MEWFRVYTRTLDSAKVQKLVPVLFKHWFNLCCLARIHDGPLPGFDVIGFRLRVSEAQVRNIIDSLVSAELIDCKPDGSHWMHDWDEHQRVSDNVAERVRKHRSKQVGNVTVTPQSRDRADTEQTTEQTGQNSVPPRPFPGLSEYPETAAAVRAKDAACDDLFIRRLLAVTIQCALSDPDIPPAEVDKITDQIVADAVKESFATFNGKKSHGTGLLLSRVPQIVRNWCKEPG